jgi:uncharacterized membrane protein YhaH (DUF805 family)
VGFYGLAFRQYANLRGRSTRPEYWWFAIVNALVLGLLVALDGALGWIEAGQDFGLLSGVYTVIVLMPAIAVGVRRLHDRNASGWWLLLSVIPLLGSVILFFMLVTPGTMGSNRFGPDPKGRTQVVSADGSPPPAARKGRLVECPSCGRSNPIGRSKCQWCRTPYNDGSI